jgi:hypothetical protein
LTKYLDVVVQATGKDDPSQIRFFVPLCGKTQDLKFLYDQGFHVVGCEGVEKACVEFYEENGMEYSRKEMGNGVTLFQVIVKAFFSFFLSFKFQFLACVTMRFNIFRTRMRDFRFTVVITLL